MSPGRIAAFLPLISLIGCGDPPCDCEWLDTGGVGGDAQEELTFLLSPDVAQAGDVFITSLIADGTDAFDYARVEELVFYGDVQVCTMQARGDELLISIGVSDSAPTREVDLVVVMDDGETHFAEAALTVLGGDGSGGGGAADGAMCAN